MLVCLRRIINTGVVYDHDYRDMSGLEKLRNAGVVVRNFKVSKASDKP